MFMMRCKLQLHPSMGVAEGSKEKDLHLDCDWEMGVCDRVSGISHAFPSVRAPAAEGEGPAPRTPLPLTLTSRLRQGESATSQNSHVTVLQYSVLNIGL